ncbi:hypothetical protein [Thaumasiovibrio subtropicus]|uniref:hypothetical protein n=1 Tax=Thaumasiovibrio subtropicus TaxID=1891207 RepID=UPI000B362A22|nr:hypothetical protein [Thaumasiovibrio subtropicus]
MELLKQAQILIKQPLTIESLRELDKLCEQAKGVEADRLGDIWEAAMVSSDTALFNQAVKEGLF